MHPLSVRDSVVQFVVIQKHLPDSNRLYVRNSLHTGFSEITNVRRVLHVFIIDIMIGRGRTADNLFCFFELLLVACDSGHDVLYLIGVENV